MRFLTWLFVVCISLATMPANSQNSSWKSTLKTQLDQMDKAKPEGWPPHIAILEKMADDYPGEWLLQYYAGWAGTHVSFVSSKSDAESLVKKAERFVKKALDMQPENTETLTLMAYWLSARINAVPARGATLGEESRKYAEKGIDADSNNPRAWLVKALNIYYTPKIFGGGKDKAKSVVEVAGTKFAAFRPGNSLAPNWGRTIYDALSDSYK